MWKDAFVATAVALGESDELARAWTGECELAKALASPDKRARAKALAAAIAKVAFELERAEVVWAP